MATHRAPVDPDAPPEPPKEQKPPGKAKPLKLEEQLVYLGERAGAGIAIFAPITGTTFVVKTPVAAQGLMMLAKKYPGLKRGLEGLVSVSAYGFLAEFVGAIMVAAGIESGRLPPDIMVAQMLGVTEIAQAVMAQRGEVQGGPVEGDGQGAAEGLLADLVSETAA